MRLLLGLRLLLHLHRLGRVSLRWRIETLTLGRGSSRACLLRLRACVVAMLLLMRLLLLNWELSIRSRSRRPGIVRRGLLGIGGVALTVLSLRLRLGLRLGELRRTRLDVLWIWRCLLTVALLRILLLLNLLLRRILRPCKMLLLWLLLMLSSRLGLSYP